MAGRYSPSCQWPSILYQAYAVGSNNETTRESERIKAMIRSLEMQRDMESIQAQKEILQSLIQAATYMFERKMDYFQEAFRTFAQHLALQAPFPRVEIPAWGYRGAASTPG